jgi:hypothetical protein
LHFVPSRALMTAGIAVPAVGLSAAASEPAVKRAETAGGKGLEATAQE